MEDTAYGSFMLMLDSCSVAVHLERALNQTGALHIINGIGGTNLIAGYAKKYYAAISNV